MSTLGRLFRRRDVCSCCGRASHDDEPDPGVVLPGPPLDDDRLPAMSPDGTRYEVRIVRSGNPLIDWPASVLGVFFNGVGPLWRAWFAVRRRRRTGWTIGVVLPGVFLRRDRVVYREEHPDDLPLTRGPDLVAQIAAGVLRIPPDA